MKELHRFSGSPEEQKLFEDILTKGIRTSHNPILWNGCGKFENQIIYKDKVYEHSISFGHDRILQIEPEDLNIVHQDPESPYMRDKFTPHVSDEIRRIVSGEVITE